MGLFIEFLNKELNISYEYLADLGGVSKQCISSLRMSYGKAVDLFEAIKKANIEDYNALKKYYEMELRWKVNYCS